VRHSLEDVEEDSPDVIVRSLSAYSLGPYNHFGDAVVHKYDMTDYLLVPIEEKDGAVAGAVAVFRCSNLSLVDYAELHAQGINAGWCAVDGAGILFSSPGRTRSLFRYDLDWERVHSEGIAEATFLEELPLLNEQGGPLDINTMQGGEFAVGGKLLYLLSGFYQDNHQEAISEGIHVIDSSTWRRVEHSTNGHGYFNYYYNPGDAHGEPEGLTVWDLDDDGAPGIRGQLHALMLDNEINDDVHLYHYTNVWRVDANSPCQTGEPACPFKTVSSAAAVIFPRSEMRIRANNYPETLTIAKRVRMTAEGGTVRIGG
jgi:hypothetical protein